MLRDHVGLVGLRNSWGVIGVAGDANKTDYIERWNLCDVGKTMSETSHDWEL